MPLGQQRLGAVEISLGPADIVSRVRSPEHLERGAIGVHRLLQPCGISETAVRTQIWIALSVYVLVTIIKKRLASTSVSTQFSRS